MHARLALLMRAAVVAGLAVATSGPVQAAGERQMSPVGLLPATFAGTGPDGRRWQVDLLPGGSYQLRQTPAAGQATDTLGRYTLEGQRLVLLGAPGAAAWTLQRDGALRGPATGPNAGLALPRLASAAPIEPRLVLSGLFTYLADAPRIVLCADGRGLPVAQQADYLALERSYGSVRPAPGAPVWVQLAARITVQPSMDPAMPALPTLVVERFERADPQARCDDAARSDRPLLGTDWRQPGSRASLRFDGGRVNGDDGCNRFMGPAQVDGAALRLGPLVGTRRACVQGQAEADAFGAALQQVQRYRIQGEQLELLDGEGGVRLRLQAAP